MNKIRSLQAVGGTAVAEARGAKALALAAELRGLAASLERQPDERVAPAPADLLALARVVAGARADLDRAIGTPWLTDPALEVLLGAFVSERSGLTTSGQAALANVPHTARRWIAMLAQAGLLEGAADGAPRLTEQGHQVVTRYLMTLAGGVGVAAAAPSPSR